VKGQQHGFVTARPFRSRHNTISEAGQPAPGEVSLAHNGVLFLDVLPEFHRSILEVMRQPFEDGKVTTSLTGDYAVCGSEEIMSLGLVLPQISKEASKKSQKSFTCVALS
jgi:hypothetical protein